MSVFDNGLCWTLYKLMEADFVNYLDYVPFTNDNANVYSSKLLAMLLQICGYVDSVFKEMAKYDAFNAVQECQDINKLESNDYHGYNIHCARKAFEKLYRLSTNNSWPSNNPLVRSQIIARLDWTEPRKPKLLTPFEAFGDPQGVPSWWSKYNDVKHLWQASIKEANMNNVLNALAGAFLLNAVHLPSIEILHQIGTLRAFHTVGGKIFTAHSDSPDDMGFRIVIGEGRLSASKSEPVCLDWNYSVETRLFQYTHPRKPRFGSTPYP